MEFAAELKALQDEVNAALNGCFAEDCAQKELLDAMRYSLLAGGKRIRPVLVLKFCEAALGNRADALPAACGIEMLHTYSLIHDDLPCMDNDDLRRGRPTCHKVYGETTAVLAGDALQSAAYVSVLSSPAAPERTAAMAKTLAEAAAERGMCGGQYLDTSKEGQILSENELYEIHRLKTGALLRAACVMGVQCAGGTPEQVKAAEVFAENLGLAFQIRDDVLDCISTEGELGKPIGSDREEGKTTFASLLGLDECARLVHRHTELAKAALEGVFTDKEFLCRLADALADRRK
jgi:geranylgeranyl diphosphate synthase, type II